MPGIYFTTCMILQMNNVLDLMNQGKQVLSSLKGCMQILY